MKILVTGADGQLGRELTACLGEDALGLNRQALDITDQAAVLGVISRQRPGAVINAAAYTAVDKAEQDAQTAFAINRGGAAHLAQACAGQGIPLLHVSTDYVFDGSKGSPYTESDAPAPTGVYGQSKWAGEQAVREHCARHLILRISWVFGAHGHNFVKSMLRLARERPELRVVDDQHGCPTHAGAAAAQLAGLARKAARGDDLPWGTYHYCGSPATSWHGFASAIVRAAQRHGLIEHTPPIHPIATHEYPTPARRPANSVLDCGHIARELGIQPVPWARGLDEVLRALKASA